MKKIFTFSTFLLAVSIFCVSSVRAQVTVGAGVGIVNSSWSGSAVGSLNDLVGFTDGIISTGSRTGFYAGAFAEMPLSEHFSLQPGVYYAQKGYRLQGKVDGKGLDFLGVHASAVMQSHYIDVPLVLKANVTNGLYVYAGPQLSYLVKNNLRMEAGVLGLSLIKTNMDVTNAFNRADWAITGGVGYTFDNGITIQAGYDHGLSALDKNNMTESYNRSFKAGLAFRF